MSEKPAQIDTGSAHLPFCDRCTKRVERVRISKDIARGLTVFRFYCHGETEALELTDADLILAAGSGPGLAFVKSSDPPS